MKLSTRMRYGSRAMVDLALAYPRGAVSLKEMAENQRLSVKYLEQIMVALKNAGLAKVTRGKHGGYALARTPADICLLDIYCALEGPLLLADCAEGPEICDRSEGCVTREVWVEMNRAIEAVMKRTSLQGLMKKKMTR